MNNHNQIIMVDSLIGNDYTLCLVLDLVKNGVNVEFVVPENREFISGVPFDIKRWAPAKDTSYGKTVKTVKYFSYLFRLIKYSYSNKNKIVHFQFFRRTSDSIAFYLMSMLGVKLVYTAHNILPHQRGSLDKYLQYLVYKSASAIIVHSMFIKKKLLNNYKISENKINVIPHGNFDIYLPQERITSDEARSKLGLSPKDKVFLFFGVIRDYKGVDILLDAFDIVKDCDSQTKLIIAGDPSTEESKNYYKKRVNQISQDRIITYFNFVPPQDIQVYFEAADIVVLPYKRIDHSGIIHLAYSFSKPVITSSAGDFPESVEEGKSGFVLKENNPDTLSKTMLNAVKDKEKLLKMGLYARHLNDTMYSWSDIARKTKEIYKRL